MVKLNVCIMGQDCEKFLPLCLKSIADADNIIYCDGGSKDKSIEIVSEYTKNIIYNEYSQDDKKMNGKQRNFYLNYLKSKHMDEWVLVLDADEVLDEEGIKDIKEMIEEYEECKSPFRVFDVHMRHFEGDLGHEDAMQQQHVVLRRLFKVSEDLYYPETEHPVLLGKDIMQPKENIALCFETTIWHLGYIPNIWDIKKKYCNHLKKSEMHSAEFLKQWYYGHLFGIYPKKNIQLIEIPKYIFNEFGIDKDEFYFMTRTFDIKHPLMVKQWYEYFKPNSLIDLGCGRGPYLYFWKWFVKDSSGIEISKFAINTALTSDIILGDIKDNKCYKKVDLITAIDVLEHLEENEIDIVLKNISDNCKAVIFSIPFEGNPHLRDDITHKIFWTKEQWENKLSKYFDIVPTPKEWLFKEQTFIGVSKNG